MPPVRTASAVKVTKTERTHEENQERAYIAASRRSDRSIEARLESAKRASEIHKKRTGRALKITQEDVENEEMYEEEDGDLRHNMRQLAAAQQSWYSSSPEFYRLQAFIATQNMPSNCQAPLMGAPQGNQQTPAQYPPNSYLAHLVNRQLALTNMQMQLHAQQAKQYEQQQQQQQQPGSHSPPSSSGHPLTIRSPGSYRHAPYPQMPRQQQTSDMYPRSASIAVPAEGTNNTIPQNHTRPESSRRNSTPIITPSSSSSDSPTKPQLTRAPSSSTSAPTVLNAGTPPASEESMSSRPTPLNVNTNLFASPSAYSQPQSASILPDYTGTTSMAGSSPIINSAPPMTDGNVLDQWLNNSMMYPGRGGFPYGNVYGSSPMLAGAQMSMNQSLSPNLYQTNFTPMTTPSDTLVPTMLTTQSPSAYSLGMNYSENFNDSLTLSPDMVDGTQDLQTDSWARYLNDDRLDD